MTWRDFGTYLLQSEELDPQYCMGARYPWPNRNMQKRWCLALWLFAHLGIAARIAEQPDFYPAVRRALDERWRPGRPRRGFVGQKAKDAIQWFEAKGTAEAVVDWMTEPRDFEAILKRTETIPMFGGYFAFKIGDVGERVLRLPITFRAETVAIYASPKAGAELIHNIEGWNDLTVASILTRLTKEFRPHLAPPQYDRPVGIQEVETICCKYKSHVDGYYPLGCKTRQYIQQLDGWGDLATDMARYLPKDDYLKYVHQLVPYRPYTLPSKNHDATIFPPSSK